VGGEGLDAVGPLEGGRVRDRTLAEAAPELVEGRNAVAVHPVAHLDLERAQVVGAVAQQGRGHHGHVRPGEQDLEDVGAAWTPVEAASDTRWRRCRMAIQRSGSLSSVEVLSSSAGSTAMVSMSRPGWYKRLNRTSPLAPASTSWPARLVRELN
jgi:hypothetical protein